MEFHQTWLTITCVIFWAFIFFTTESYCHTNYFNIVFDILPSLEIFLITIIEGILFWLGELQGFLYILFKNDNAKEGGSVNRPQILDGTNNDNLKACMAVFLKSRNNETWKVVINGWTPPHVILKDNTKTFKPKKSRSKKEDEESLGNFYANLQWSWQEYLHNH